MLLNELLGGDKSPLASTFLHRLLHILEDFPILLLFESRTRIELLFLLQCVRASFPYLITERPSLVLLVDELWLWFDMNKGRLHTQPFFSLIDSTYFFKQLNSREGSMVLFFSTSCRDEPPLSSAI